MTFRYNPQSIEKQVKKWPVFFSEKELQSDIKKRLSQLLGTHSWQWINPFVVFLPFDKEVISEYGIDACRLALINSKDKEPEKLLESSYKWIAKLHKSLNSTNDNYFFNPIPWLEAIIQFEDHIISRESPNLALALVMKAAKIAPPCSNISEEEKKLISACLFPFIPVYSSYYLCEPSKFDTIKNIVNCFEEYYCVKVALEKGGWHWQVFSKKAFNDNPIKELSKIKWINKAIKDKKTILKEIDGGIRICFY